MELPKKLMDLFYNESSSRIKQLEELLEKLLQGAKNKAIYKDVYDRFHKYHGSCEIYGFKDAGDIAAIAEKYMTGILERGLTLNDAQVQTLLDVKDFIKSEIHKEPKEVLSVNDLMEKLNANFN